MLRADLVIGADGNSSIVRSVVFGEAEAAQSSGLTVYSGIIDTEKMLSDPELRPLALVDDVSPFLYGGTITVLKAGQWPIWTGPHRSCVGKMDGSWYSSTAHIACPLRTSRGMVASRSQTLL